VKLSITLIPRERTSTCHGRLIIRYEYVAVLLNRYGLPKHISYVGLLAAKRRTRGIRWLLNPIRFGTCERNINTLVSSSRSSLSELDAGGKSKRFELMKDFAQSTGRRQNNIESEVGAEPRIGLDSSPMRDDEFRLSRSVDNRQFGRPTPDRLAP
jgi:hypothetical protein